MTARDFFYWLEAYCLGQVITEQFLHDEWERMVEQNKEEDDFRRVNKRKNNG